MREIQRERERVEKGGIDREERKSDKEEKERVNKAERGILPITCARD